MILIIKKGIEKFKLNVNAITDILHLLDIKIRYFIGAGILSFGTAFFEGISIGLLIPVIKGLIKMDFGFVRKFPVINSLITRFPRLFFTPNSSMFILLLSIIFISVIFKNILRYTSSLITFYQARKYSTNLRKLLLDRYLNFGKLFFDRTPQGYNQQIIMDYTNSIARIIASLYILFMRTSIILIYFVVMIVISWRLTLFVIIVPVVLYYSSHWLIKKISSTSIYYTKAQKLLNIKIFDIFSCFPIIKAYIKEDKEKKDFAKLSDTLENFNFSLDKKRNLVEPFNEIIGLIIFLSILSITALLIMKERLIDLSSFLIYFYLLRKLLDAFAHLTKLWSEIAALKGPIEKIKTIFDDRNKYFVPEGDKEFKGLKDSIEFKNLKFSYLKEVPVLKNVSFYIEKGKMTAIVGPTGAGKTTLINLLLRFYDCPSSSIFIDGVDIRDFTSTSLRSHMALVSQEISLFNNTIKTNILYGSNKKIPEEKLVEIVKNARLYDFILSLPDGFETLIGDRGVKLSGGEKQRIAIARALIKNAPILILDEATSSLDSITERLIQEAINEAVRYKTSIVIAHRLSTVKNADKIIVIENGSAIEEGGLKELLDKKGKFYGYWQEQKFD